MLFKSTQVSIEKSLSQILIIYQVTGVQYFSLYSEPLENTAECRITRNHKIFLVANLLIVTAEFCAVIYAISLEAQQKHHNNIVTGLIVQFSTYNLMILLMITTVLNSLVLRKKAKQIFKNCKNISEIYLVLNQIVDFSTFKHEFKITFGKLGIAFIGSTLGTLIFIYQYNQTNVFLWAVLAVYPYFFTMITISYWILLIRLVRENLRFIKKRVLLLHKKHKLFRVNMDIFSHDLKSRRNDEAHNVIVKLKRIYGIVYDITCLINELIGIPICLILIVIVIGNISAGYKVFLSIRGDIPMERVAGKDVYDTMKLITSKKVIYIMNFFQFRYGLLSYHLESSVH